MSKIQRMPNEEGWAARPKIVIPKRGEKDFEPLQETVKLQEMMLQRSREALFGALEGVRGSSRCVAYQCPSQAHVSKTMSHALLTPSSPFPQMIVSRGHIFDSVGLSVRHTNPHDKGKGKTRTELLPEEALYMLERGSLQIWLGPEAGTEAEESDAIGVWKDEEWGVGGAVEMSVMEGFTAFIGQEGLTWERYQVFLFESVAVQILTNRLTHTSKDSDTQYSGRVASCLTDSCPRQIVLFPRHHAVGGPCSRGRFSLSTISFVLQRHE